MTENKCSFDLSLNDTSELRKLIIENPDLPLLVFCCEDVWNGDYTYEQAEVTSVTINELTLYKDKWMDVDEYEEELSDDLCDAEEYKHLSDKEYENMIQENVNNAEFVRAIIVYVG